MKHTLRKVTNGLAQLAPKPLVRYWLKSYWYQPQLQDALRYHIQPYRVMITAAFLTRVNDLDLERLKKPRQLPGIKLESERYLKLVDDLFPYAGEILGYPIERTGDSEFWFRNHAYQDLDAVTLYCMVRHFKPRRIIETGCGFSSRVISIAARKNASEGHPVQCTFIDPYPSERILRERLAGPLVEKRA